MTQKGKPIQLQHSVIMGLISHLKELPSRDTNANKVLTLTQIFHTEEFKKEVQSLLQKGYLHSEIAAIITEKCGVHISERQVKYHCTRAANTKKYKKSSRKATQKVNETSNNPGSIIHESSRKPEKVSPNATKTSINDVATSAAKDEEKVEVSSTKAAAKPGSFEINMQTDEI